MRLPVLLAVMVCLLVAGCGDSEEASEADSSTTSTEAESGSRNPDDIYNTCIRDLAETEVAPELAQMTCAQARALYSNCRIAASEKGDERRDAALATCEREADEGLAELAESAPD